MTQRGTCVMCGNQFVRDGRSRARYCLKPCSVVADRARSRAYGAVKAATIAGQLLPAFNFQCADCGAPAREYDHRDYARPLQVDPVCRSCNLRRGPAVFHSIAA